MTVGKIKLSFLLLVVVATSWSCKVFLGNWGQEGYPCEDDSQCNSGLECLQTAGICLSQEHLDKFACTEQDVSPETCEDHLGQDWHCHDGQCNPDNRDEVRWCLDDPGVCQQNETCAMGILCKKNASDEFLGIVCDPQASKPCDEGASYVCAPFRKPGEDADQYHCTPKCGSNDDCPEKYSCALVATGALYCAKQEWTSGMGFVCEDKSECPLESQECVTVEYGSGPTAQKICTEPCGSCEAGYTCCKASEQSDEFCLMGYLCYGGCTPDCSSTECGMDPNSCASCGTCPDGEHCEDGTCVNNPAAPKFPLVLDIGNTGIGSIASVSISGQTDGVFYVAHSGTTIGEQGASTWEITTNPTGNEGNCQKGIPCVTAGPSRYFDGSSKVTSVSFRWDSYDMVAFGKVELMGWQVWTGNAPNTGHTIATLSYPMNSMLQYYPENEICILAQIQAASDKTLELDKISLSSENQVADMSVQLQAGSNIITDMAMSENSLHSAAVCTSKAALQGGNLVIVNTDSFSFEKFQGTSDDFMHFEKNAIAMTFVPDPDPEQGTIVVALDHNASNPIRLLSSELDQGTGQITWHEEKSFPLPHYDQDIIALASTLHPNYDGTNKLRVLLGLEESGIIDAWTIDENKDLNFLGALTAPDFEVSLGLGDLAVSPVDRANPGAAYMALSGNAKVLLWPLESFLRTTIGFGYPCDPEAVAGERCEDYQLKFVICDPNQHVCTKGCSNDEQCPKDSHCNISTGYCEL